MSPKLDARIRLIVSDERDSRVLAFNGGKYPQGEVYRLLRLALDEIDALREDLKSAEQVADGYANVLADRGLL